jgi:hypothetical protein
MRMCGCRWAWRLWEIGWLRLVLEGVYDSLIFKTGVYGSFSQLLFGVRTDTDFEHYCMN